MKTYKLDNGFSVCLVPIASAKIVSMRLVIRTGVAYESKKTLGYSHMLEHILLDSNPKYPGTKGIEILESKGIDMNASTGPTIVDYRFTGATKHWTTMFDFVYYPLVAPKFTKRVFDREKKAIVEELKNHLDDKLRLYKDKIMETIYKGSVLEYYIAETLASTHKCTLSDITKFYNERYSPENVTLLVVGNFPMRKLCGKIKKFNSFKPSDLFQLDASGDETSNDAVYCPDIAVAKPGKEIYVKCPNVSKIYCDIIFKLDIEPFTKEYYTGKMLEYILTNGFLSILYKKLRLDKNWIYHMNSELSVTCYDSDFTITFNTDPKNFKLCVKEIFKSIKSLRHTIPPKTFAMSKEKIKTDMAKTITNNKINQTNSFISDQIEAGVKPTPINMFYDNLLKVTIADIKRFVDEYLEKSNAYIFYGGAGLPKTRTHSKKSRVLEK